MTVAQLKAIEHEQSDQDSQVISWHTLPEERVLEKLQITPAGLSDQQVAERLTEFGPNTLPVKPPPTLPAVFLHQFLSPLIYILLVAGAVSSLLGEIKDAVFIFVVVLLNATIGTYQEWKAERSAAALQSLLKIYARVKRGDQQKQVTADELVPGDVVLLESGNRVPADLRLIQTNNLAIDESFLTGESLAAGKSLVLLAADSPLSERANMAFAGSTVTSGRGIGVVAATGLHTEVGRIAETVTSAAMTKPPLVVRMERFARQTSYAVLGASTALSLIAISKGIPYSEVFFLAVALAVSAIPEGLPVAITVVLSIGTGRMARRNVIVRRLAAVESLGSCTYIASDKTGTLTVNQQTVKLITLPSGERFTVSGEGYSGEGQALTEAGQPLADPAAGSPLDRLARAAILCNEAQLSRDNEQWTHHGDAIDVALLAFGYKVGLAPERVRGEVEPVAEIPFESERGYAVHFNQAQGRVRVAVKGAVEKVLPLCQTRPDGRGVVEIDPEKIEQEALALSESGYRVLAVAEGEVDRRASAQL